MEQGAPIGDFCRLLNKTYESAYEWDRHEYGPGAEQFGGEVASREEWGLDLSRLRCQGATWGDNLTDIQNHVLFHVIQNAIENRDSFDSIFPDDLPNENYREVSRNITNAWRDEFALNDPLDGSTDDRMKTAEWRIVMAYYAVFKATSGLMYCAFDEIRDNGNGGSHARMWQKHRRELMTPLGNSLYVFPFMYFPQATTGQHASNWFDWTVPYPIPDDAFESQEAIMKENAREGLRYLYDSLEEFDWTNENALNTFYDALLMLRQWANYQHGGVFSRLYGDGYKQSIDEALRLVTFTGLAIAEVGIIMAHGWERFNAMWQVFWANAHAGVDDSYDVAKHRVMVYNRVFSD